MIKNFKSKQSFAYLSIASALSTLILNGLFQRMAYWGNGLFWFWIGVFFTYLIWLMGVVFLVIAIRNKQSMSILSMSGWLLHIVAALLLTLTFFYTTFIIIMGNPI